MRTIQVRHIARREVEGADVICDDFRNILLAHSL